MDNGPGLMTAPYTTKQHLAGVPLDGLDVQGNVAVLAPRPTNPSVTKAVYLVSISTPLQPRTISALQASVGGGGCNTGISVRSYARLTRAGDKVYMSGGNALTVMSME